MIETVHIADLFCGAGGTSTGAIEAVEELGFKASLTAINHWDIAVQTHSANHPGARHLCASLDSLNPRDLFKPGELDILWGSPECTHHSVARGGKPINDQSRATAWCLVRWAEALMPRQIWVENVPEFRSWAPCGSNGRPLKSKRGEIFEAWMNAFDSMGYRGEARELVAADHGDATSRTRLIIQFVRGRARMAWPEPSHYKSENLFGKPRWRGAREIIDWNLKGTPISQRKRPLADTTMDRIRAGLRKFGGKPFVVAWDHQSSNTGELSIDEPLGTVTTKARHGVAEPFIVDLRGTAEKQVEASARSIDDPLSTVAASGTHHGLVEPFLVSFKEGQERRLHSLNDPLPTQTCSNQFGLCDPFLVQYYGNGMPRSINDPLDTVTTHDRFGLCEPMKTRVGIDVRFRMLQPHELAAAQGFPKDYKFCGTKTQIVKQIGNAVPKGLAKALVRAGYAQFVRAVA